VLSGPALPQAWQSFFVSLPFRIGAGFALADQLSNVISVLPDDFVPVIDALGVGLGTTVQGSAIVGDGFVTLAFDVANPIVGVSTMGSPSKVGSFLS
jgi:hypothetical protein